MLPAKENSDAKSTAWRLFHAQQPLYASRRPFSPFVPHPQLSLFLPFLTTSHGPVALIPLCLSSRMFAKSLVLLSLASAALANIAITNPVASTQVKGGSTIVRGWSVRETEQS
jgi:hypothetical protein